jgi:uncharacterized protein
MLSGRPFQLSFLRVTALVSIAAIVLFWLLRTTPAPAGPIDVATLTWDDLIPSGEVRLMQEQEDEMQQWLDNLHNAPPQRLSEATPYSAMETVAGFTQRIEGYTAVQSLDGRMVKIPGFMVPLEFGSPGKMRDFLLVPYFGACIHVPPPPPNQIIHVKTDDEIDMEDIWGAVWVTGKLEVTSSDTDFAHTFYTLTLDQIDLYEEDW